jgi:hypothetical protein
LLIQELAAALTSLPGIGLSIRHPPWVDKRSLKRSKYSQGPDDPDDEHYIYTYTPAHTGWRLQVSDKHEDIDLFSEAIQRKTMVVSISPPLPVRDIIANMDADRYPLILLCNTVRGVSNSLAENLDFSTQNVQYLIENMYDPFCWNVEHFTAFKDLTIYVLRQQYW